MGVAQHKFRKPENHPDDQNENTRSAGRGNRYWRMDGERSRMLRLQLWQVRRTPAPNTKALLSGLPGGGAKKPDLCGLLLSQRSVDRRDQAWLDG
jgi:hypothetical protein